MVFMELVMTRPWQDALWQVPARRFYGASGRFDSPIWHCMPRAWNVQMTPSRKLFPTKDHKLAMFELYVARTLPAKCQITAWL
jgi:hypothetical protein